MKKRILTAIVCAAMVLSLAGCASDSATSAIANMMSKAENETSKAANQTGKPTSSAAVSTAGTAASKPETSVNSTASSATSNTDKPNVNLADWQYSTYNEDNGEITIRIEKYKDTDAKVEIPAEINGIKATSIGRGAFEDNIDITGITIPESITFIGSGAFNQCINLSEITFKGSMPYLHVGKDNEYGNLNYPLDIFNGTPWLEAKKAEDPNFFIIGDTLIQGLGCEGDITIPEGVKKIGNAAFAGNEKITSVAIPDGVTEIGANAFSDCSNLVSVTIPDSVTNIGYEAFYRCPSLQSVNIPQNIVTIGDKAFGKCRKLAGSFTLPGSIRMVGMHAFSDEYLGGNVEVVYKDTVYKVGNNGCYELIAAIEQNAIDEEFGDKDFVITDDMLVKIKPGTTKIELPRHR